MSLLSIYRNATKVGYFSGGKGIDIVADHPNIRNILLEVKCREQAPVSDDSAIAQLCGEAGAALTITKRFDACGLQPAPCGKQMIRIPAFAFLFLLGHAEKSGHKGGR